MSERIARPIGIGGVLGFAVIGIFILSAWCIRPAVLPRHGQWSGDGYYIQGRRCGHISDWTSLGGGIDASANPPLWIGMGGFDTYQTQSAAKKKVEDWCK